MNRRNDRRSAEADVLYKSVTEKRFTLPGETLAYLAHNYKERLVSLIAQEQYHHPRLIQGE